MIDCFKNVYQKSFEIFFCFYTQHATAFFATKNTFLSSEIWFIASAVHARRPGRRSRRGRCQIVFHLCDAALAPPDAPETLAQGPVVGAGASDPAWGGDAVQVPDYPVLDAAFLADGDAVSFDEVAHAVHVVVVWGNLWFFCYNLSVS